MIKGKSNSSQNLAQSEVPATSVAPAVSVASSSSLSSISSITQQRLVVDEDLNLLKTIEIETNKNLENKLKQAENNKPTTTTTTHSFHFLRSKPPLSK